MIAKVYLARIDPHFTGSGRVSPNATYTDCISNGRFFGKHEISQRSGKTASAREHYYTRTGRCRARQGFRGMRPEEFFFEGGAPSSLNIDHGNQGGNQGADVIDFSTYRSPSSPNRSEVRTCGWTMTDSRMKKSREPRLKPKQNLLKFWRGSSHFKRSKRGNGKDKYTVE